MKNKHWWEGEFQRCGGLFNFREMLMSYCANDVTVLRLCALKFRQLFIELCGIDPFGSVTIASACQKYFRTFLLEENTIAIISQHGYTGNRRYSMESIEWLEWINTRNGGRI